ncbi:MAG TPA: N-acetyltransferase, partial [Ignavibacteriales bacterium]|nr:N-acetyltransferase [Ignavibacteriales bacterium]
WGTTYNRALKNLMLNYAFKFVEKVIFYIGVKNIRSQKAIEKLGAKYIGKKEIVYPSENERLSFIYEMDKSTWVRTAV